MPCLRTVRSESDGAQYEWPLLFPRIRGTPSVWKSISFAADELGRELRDEDQINDEVLRTLQHELGLAEPRAYSIYSGVTRLLLLCYQEAKCQQFSSRLLMERPI